MSGEHPWIKGDLKIHPNVLEAVYADAIACYPSESCGFIYGPAEDWPLLDEMSVQVNEADKYHALDPERFPRTSREYFKINELKAAKAFRAADANQRPIKVIYHSHCDCDSYFSEEDATTFASEQTLMWPCAFLVVSVYNGQVKDHNLWVHRPGSNEFDRSTLVRC